MDRATERVEVLEDTGPGGRGPAEPHGLDGPVQAGPGGTAVLACPLRLVPAPAAAGTGAETPPATRAGRKSNADRFARWALRIRGEPGDAAVYNIFSSSIALSAARCVLTYVLLPMVVPWLGALPRVGPAIGLPLGALALVFDVRAVRRFFQAEHQWRWAAAALYLAVMAMVSGLMFVDISRLT